MSMKKIIHLFCFLLYGLSLSAQVTCDPVFPTVDDNVTLFYTAADGNAALVGASAVYIHTGVITNLSTSGTDWKHVVTTWGTNNTAASMQLVSAGVFKKSFNIRTFYNIAANETVLKMAFVFRNADGTVVGRASDGSDIFYEVFPAGGALLTKFIKPEETVLLKNIGEMLPIKAAASQSCDLTLLDNGTSIATANASNIETTVNVTTAGLHQVLFIAKTATVADSAHFTYIVPTALVTEEPPIGTDLGAEAIDAQTMRLSFYAPLKSVIYVIGDFNDWTPQPAYQMKRSVDAKTWWLDVPIPAGQTKVKYQFFVDGEMKVADPYSTLVLDQWNDAYIPAATYPNLPAYPYGKTTGTVTYFDMSPTPFNWQTTTFERPKKTDLVIYELLARDFVARHDFQTIHDTLDYIQKLGVNAIELMPLNEFDGNINWGYGPAFHRALDKYYGSPEAFKTLVDACHARGIAVIVDVVFNHITGASPFAQMYWDQANNRPATNNPWLNPTAKHDFNVFNDFNHESTATIYYVKSCLKYWLDEYHVDGYRFDLSKGFTQKNTLGNIGAWGQYDIKRVATLKDYADLMWSVSPNSYMILEHLADNAEEKVLANYGMMLWGNMWGGYKDVALGVAAGWGNSLSNISYKTRTWNDPHLVGYMESHDEERIAYECKNYGAVSGSYNVKTFATGMKRLEMLQQLFFTIPGPKMLWQFGELGYDYSINYCENGTINTDCRTSPKPIRWDYFQVAERRHLYDVTRALTHLRTTEDVFETTTFQQISKNSGKGRIVKLNGTDTNVFVIVNVGITEQIIATDFQHTGQWFEYYTGASINVDNLTANMTLQPGEYRLFIDKFVALPPGVNFPTETYELSGDLSALSVFPNPTNEQVTIAFQLQKASKVQVALFDLTGKQISILSEGLLSAGEQVLDINLRVAQGIYFLKVLDENGAFLCKKVVKM
jgi:glycosidase